MTPPIKRRVKISYRVEREVVVVATNAAEAKRVARNPASWKQCADAKILEPTIRAITGDRHNGAPIE